MSIREIPTVSIIMASDSFSLTVIAMTIKKSNADIDRAINEKAVSIFPTYPSVEAIESETSLDGEENR